MLPGSHSGQTAGPAGGLDEIRRLVASGNLVEATQRYGQAYNVDEQEARSIIAAIQGGRLATAAAPGMRAPEELTRALEEVQARLKAGDKIGAIKIYREHYDVGLERAKYAVEQIQAGQTLQPETGFQALNRSAPTYAAQSARSGGMGGGIIAIVVLLVIAGIVGFIIFASSGGLGKHYDPETPLVLVPSGNVAAPQIAGVFYNSDADTRSIGLVDPATGKLLWQAAKLAGDGNADAVAAGTDLIFAANATTLLAYHKSDGSLAWQAQMSDKLNYGAATLLVSAGRVITNNADQTIQAYDAGTGHQVWSKRLNGNDSTLRLMGNSLVVLDYTDSNNDYGLLFLDPATGTQQNVLTPSCNSNDFTANLDTESGILYDQAANTLYLVYDSYGCVQRLDLASGKTVWEADSKDDFNFAADGLQSLMTDSTLYFSNGNDLLAVDKSSGNMKVLLTNPDYQLLPLAMAGNNLIVRARKTRGTESFELWGVDAASGSQTWQVDLTGSSPIDPPNQMAGLIDNTGSGWTWKLASTGLVVATFQAQPNQLILETFNPATGNSTGKQAIALKNVSGDFYDIPTVLGWQDNIAYVSIDLEIYSLDITTGQLKAIY
jgi:ribosomal protein L7/L12